ncbi:hypothetical protein EMPS_10671 [Entomortierella parvispora]|uniref:Arm-like repeat domain-containing protein n=1 Tax=Entomortierella parvispora TaxID=205924 RepID=A0A9P3HKG6_9FUNG|nr:hypothetical protein EMPS_10671 [Entomortierella parvispora]
MHRRLWRYERLKTVGCDAPVDVFKVAHVLNVLSQVTAVDTNLSRKQSHNTDSLTTALISRQSTFADAGPKFADAGSKFADSGSAPISLSHPTLKAQSSTSVDSLVVHRRPTPVFLPENDETIEDTAQLFQCVHLLQKACNSAIPSTIHLSSANLQSAQEGDQEEWIQFMQDNPLEKEHLFSLMSRMASMFMVEPTRDSDSVWEVVLIGSLLNKDQHRKLVWFFLEQFEQSSSVDLDILLGLVQLTRDGPPNFLTSDDLNRILKSVRARLEGLIVKNSQDSKDMKDTKDTIYLTFATTTLLTTLTSCVSNHQSSVEYERLFATLSVLRKDRDALVKFQARYARQLLISLSNQRMDDCQDTKKSTRRLFNRLSCHLKSHRLRRWFKDVQLAKGFVQMRRFSDLYNLIQNGPSAGNTDFQWQICQLLEEMAVDPALEGDVHHQAIAILHEYAKVNGTMKSGAVIKSWARTILRRISEYTISSHPAVAHDAQTMYNEAITETNQGVVCGIAARSVKPLAFAYPFVGRLSLPASSQLLHKVNSDPDIEFAIDRLRRQRYRIYDRRAVYIQLLSKRSIQASEDVLVELQERARNFLKSKGEVLLILGDSGAGKSMFGMRLENDLWADYKPGGPIPLFVDLKTIDSLEKDIIPQHMDDMNLFTDQQIEDLQQSRKFILICDGYDECHKWTNIHTTNHLNKPRRWQAKMIITCRTQYLGPNYREYFEPKTAATDNSNFSHISDLLEEAVVVPFRTTQVREYVELFTQLPKTAEHLSQEPVWSTDQYMARLKSIANLVELAKNPFMLKMILFVLPRIAKTTNKMTRVDLYDRFVELHFKSEQQRLLKQHSNGKMDAGTLSVFSALQNNELIALGLDFSKKLSLCIFKDQQGVNSVTYSAILDSGSWKDVFFGPDPRAKLLRDSAQLVCRENCHDTRRLMRHRNRPARKRNSYEFSHRSMLEYFYSCLIFDPRGNAPALDLATCLHSTDGPSPVINHPLGQTNIVSESSIIHFLAERVHDNEGFHSQLQSILQLSKLEMATSKASSNAITILNRAGIYFNGADLRRIQIPGADLSGGQFDSTLLQNSNLSGVCLKRTWLRQANLDGATMTDVRLGEKPYLKIPDLWTAAISSDGNMIAAAGLEGKVQVYSTSDFNLRFTFEAHYGLVETISISNDSSLVASSGQDKIVRIWNLKEGGSCAFQGHASPVRSVAFSPDSNQVVSGSEDGTARVWDIQSGSNVHILEIGPAHRSVAWSLCGRQIATGSRSLMLWDAETGKLERTLGVASVSGVIYSGKGKLLAIGRGTLLVWDLVSDKEGKNPLIMKGINNFGHAIFSPDEQIIAAADLDGSIYLWDSLSGSCIASLNGHSAVVLNMAFLKDQELVSAGRDGTIRFWQLDDELDSKKNTLGDVSRHQQSHMGGIYSLVYTPSGDFIFTAGLDNCIHRWNTKSGECSRLLEVGLGARIAISSDGQQLAVANGDLRVYQLGKTDGRKEDDRYRGRASRVAYSPCGHWLALGDKDGVVRLCDLRPGKDVRVLEGHAKGIEHLTFSPTGRQLISVCEGRTIRLWDTESAEYLRDFDITGFSVSFSPCGSMLSILNSRSIRIWDLQEKKDVIVLKALDEFSRSVAWRSDGTWIGAGAFLNDSVHLWKISGEGTKRVVSDKRVIRDFLGPVRCLTWSPTNPLEFATGCDDGSVCVWRFAEGKGGDQLQLAWSSLTGRLTASGTRIDRAEGLTDIQKNLLVQRGAKNESTSVEAKPSLGASRQKWSPDQILRLFSLADQFRNAEQL